MLNEGFSLPMGLWMTALLVSPVVDQKLLKENVRALHTARMPAEFINGGQITTDLRNGCLLWPRLVVNARKLSVKAFYFIFFDGAAPGMVGGM